MNTDVYIVEKCLEHNLPSPTSIIDTDMSIDEWLFIKEQMYLSHLDLTGEEE